MMALLGDDAVLMYNVTSHSTSRFVNESCLGAAGQDRDSSEHEFVVTVGHATPMPTCMTTAWHPEVH